jgi:two-component system NtrC family sensor kinase
MANETILIVDDQADIRAFLMDYGLKPLGYRTVTATDGEKGLKAAIEHCPDLIMLDMNMPRMTGMEMLKELRKTECQAPVIFMTIYGSESIAVEAFRLGIRDYLCKPFTVEEVQDAVNCALRETRLEREKERLTRNLYAAETVRQTVITLSHYINNYLTVVDGGLRLLDEVLQQRQVEDTIIPRVISDSIYNAERIGAVIRVLQKLTEVKSQVYSEGFSMLDIKAALQEELNKI